MKKSISALITFSLISVLSLAINPQTKNNKIYFWLNFGGGPFLSKSFQNFAAYLGASPCVKFPIGELVTTIKISVFENKIEIRTGEIIDNVTDKGGCISKMLVKSNVKKILDDYDWDTFGWHRVTFIGDWRDNFIIGAKLLGLEIVDLGN